MIKIEGNEVNKIKYSCDCGIKGECLIKPQKDNRVIVLDITCPHCGDTERVKLLQFDSEEARKKLLRDDATLSWSLILDNRLRK
jgi:hypothetical protein